MVNYIQWIFGILFASVVDSSTLIFLELSHDAQGAIASKTHVKPTARNSYLHRENCHHPSWKTNIPFTQFCRLKRSCTTVADFVTQGAILKEKFSEKGYT